MCAEVLKLSMDAYSLCSSDMLPHRLQLWQCPGLRCQLRDATENFVSCQFCLQAMNVLWLGVLLVSAQSAKPTRRASSPRSKAMYSSSQGSVLLKAAYAIGLSRTTLNDGDAGFISCR